MQSLVGKSTSSKPCVSSTHAQKSLASQSGARRSQLLACRAVQQQVTAHYIKRRPAGLHA
eukprot:286620-Pelagomonas_calceolata.AAC.15